LHGGRGEILGRLHLVRVNSLFAQAAPFCLRLGGEIAAKSEKIGGAVAQITADMRYVRV
jgi:hypothetical protein